ncbi:hypothetical protein BJX66DRAFT_254273 [Aspergillus keveii]|uniref:Uncharacterized protein n=1 Tax=Aspergillus keveii TaxID=714993 RepID=A0ABR4G001_9EURO
MRHLAPTSERPSEMHGPTPLGFLRSRIALPICDSFASRRLSIWFVDPESQISSIFLSGLTASPLVRPRPDHRISFVASSWIMGSSLSQYLGGTLARGNAHSAVATSKVRGWQVASNSAEASPGPAGFFDRTAISYPLS